MYGKFVHFTSQSIGILLTWHKTVTKKSLKHIKNK